VENDRRLSWALDQQLVEDVAHNRDNKKREEGSTKEDGSGFGIEQIAQWLSEQGEKAHCEDESQCLAPRFTGKMERK